MPEVQASPAELPSVLAGPILRRLTPERLVLWLAAREPLAVRMVLEAPVASREAALVLEALAPDSGLRCLHAGGCLHLLLLDLRLPRPLPVDQWIAYRLSVRPLAEPDAPWRDHREWAPDLCYPGCEMPRLRVPGRLGAVLHGSCRKPHHRGGDGLVEADRWLAGCLAARPGPDGHAREWPSLLVMSGDQIYADDVAGPMLRAIHALIRRLGLPAERLDRLGLADAPDSEALFEHADSYYRRERLLPRLKTRSALLDVLFRGARKPVFTTDSAHNHLITLGEVLAMYLLVWSPAPWQGLGADPPDGLTTAEGGLYAAEADAIDEFVGGLPAVRRLLAHLPVAMVFDDHDVTDDWNLNRDWEETAYGHPFSTRVIGNALIGYLLNQAWGNRPEAFDDALLDALEAVLCAPGGEAHDRLVRQLLRLQNWEYQWPTRPPLVVIDTRTRRWRSETSGQRPSGLLDWEALTDLQQTLRDHDAVLLVSAPPIFGVKLIEAIQRVFSWLGRPLMVDAENWMAHPGTAQNILNVFWHSRTPSRFVVLSGDVHYSFVYDVELRGRQAGPDIWQICSSGLRNTFPERLLDTLDRLNRWLYSPRSPLNWFTRRRRMRVVPRKPRGTPPGRRLLNGSGVGLVELDRYGAPQRISQLLADGAAVVFERREAESRWE